MKKLLFFLMTLMALSLAWGGAVKAQETLPLYEGATSTNEYVPFYGWYGDEVQQNQMIYPASELSDMDGGLITQMVFYVSSQSGSNTLCNWVVSIGETSATTLSGINNSTTLTQVYSGPMTFGASSGATTMTIVFDEPYTYNGGNLLINFNNPVTSSSAYHRYYFSGVTATGASYCYGNQQNFLPKVTFSYTPAATSDCAKPGAIILGTAGATEFPISWTTGGEETSWNVYLTQGGSPMEGYNPLVVNTTPSCTFNGLTAGTTYNVAIEAICGNDVSNQRTTSFTTELCEATDLCEITFELTDSYGDGWNGNKLQVVDVNTSNVLGEFTLASGYSETFHLNVCTGRDINFVYVASGNYQYENGWSITDNNDDPIAEHTGGNSSDAATAGTIATFTPNCAPITCAKPTGLTASEITAHEAILSWFEHNDSYDIWEFEYDINDDFSSAYQQSGPFTSFSWNDSVTINLSNLDPGTTYYARVKTDCGNNDESDWSTICTFTTLASCPAPTASLTENSVGAHGATIEWNDLGSSSYNVRYQVSNSITVDFESGSLPDGWTANTSSDYSGISSGIGRDNSYAFSFYFSEDGATLVSPVLSGTENGVNFSFYYRRYSDSYVEGFKVGYNTDGSDVFTYGDEISVTNTSSWLPYENTFPAGTKRIAIKYIYHNAYYLYIDDIDITIPNNNWTTENTINTNYSISNLDPETRYLAQVQSVCEEEVSSWSEGVSFTTNVACHAPTSLAKVGNAEARQVALTWNENWANTNWQICLNGDEENLIPVTGATHDDEWHVSYTLTDLTPDQDYAVKVRSNCGNEGPSQWSNTINIHTAVACPAPTTLAAATPDPDQVELSWTKTGTETAWQLCVNGDETNPVDVDENDVTFEGTNTVKYLLTGLTAETPYTVKVRANCEVSSTGDGQSAWSNTVNFTTAAACPKPTDLTATNVTNNSATIGWNAHGETAWSMQYSEDGGTTWIDVTSTITNPFELTGLTGDTEYQVQVKTTSCTNDEWSTAATFTTKCEAITTFPWSENFEDFTANSSGVKLVDNCWVNEHISGSGSYFFEVYSGTIGTNSTKQLRLRDMSDGTLTKLMLPEMTLPGDDYLFSIDVYRVDATSYTGEGVRVYASTDGEIEGATELAFISRNFGTGDENLIPAESEVGWYTYELPIGFSGTCYIILRGESQYGSHTYMDNFAIKQIPSCVKPTALTFVSSTTTTATLSWTNGATGQTAWQIAYSTDANFNPDTVNSPVNVTSNPCNLPDLTPATTYYAYVRANCGNNDYSDWSNKVNFTTACEAINVGYTCGFEGPNTVGTSYPLPTCWSRPTGTSTQYPYAIATSYTHGGSYALYFYGSTSSSAQIAVLPEINGGVNGKMLKFYARNSSSYAASFSVGYMEDPTDASTFHVVGTTFPLSASTPYGSEPYEIDFANIEGNPAYIAIKSTSTYSWSYFYIDDISIEAIPACRPVEAISFNNVERTSMTVSWSSHALATNDAFQLVCSANLLDETDLAAADKIDVSGVLTYDFINLERNTPYYVYIRGYCGENVYSDWVSAVQSTQDLGADCSNSEEMTLLSGDGENNSQTYVPLYSNYGGEYTIQIFTAEELTSMGLSTGAYISSISFHLNTIGNTTTENKYKKTSTIWMANTEKSTFSSNNDYMTSGLTQVKNPSVTTFSPANSWIDIPFDNAFQWDGTSNLAIATLFVSTDSYTTHSFYGASLTEYRTIYCYADATTFTVNNGVPNITNNQYRSLSRADIRFTVCQEAVPCPTVTNLHADNVTTENATIQWTASTGDYVSGYQFYYSTEEVTDFDGITPQSSTTTEIPLANLTQGTTYHVYVKTVCNANSHDDGTSEWAHLSFTTLADCPAPANVEVSLTAKNAVHITWEDGDNDSENNNFQYILSTAEITDFSGYTPTVLGDDFEVSLTDLEFNTPYYLYIANNCGGSVSDYISADFITKEACPGVQNIQITEVGPNTATLTWESDEFGEESEWYVFNINNNQTWYPTERTFTVFGLEPEHVYTIQVGAHCWDEGHTTDSYSTGSEIAVTTTAASGECEQVGTGTASANVVYTSYGCTYSQHIYTADELTAMGLSAGRITAVAFYYTGNSSSYSKTQSIHIGSTTNNVFSGYTANDFISNLDTVYGPTLLSYQSGWREYPFTNAFEWDGISNIVVGVLTNSTATSSNGWSTQGTNVSSYRSIFRYKDSDPIDIDNLAAVSYGNQSQNRPNIKFCFEPASCPPVRNLTLGEVTSYSAEISWQPGGSEGSWLYYYEASDDLLTDEDLASVSTTPYGWDLSITLNAPLERNTHYYFYIKPNIQNDNTCGWKHIDFTTLATCLPPTVNEVTEDNITSNSATISWTPNSESFNTANEWKVRYREAGVSVWTIVEANIAAVDTSYELTGLNGNTTYEVEVMAICGDNNYTDDSEWSLPESFTTKCSAITTFPWSEDFESYSDGSFSDNCWVNEHISGSGSQLFKVYTSNNGSNHTHQLQLPDQSAGTLTKLRLPQMALPNTNYQFILDVYRTENTYQTNNHLAEGVRVFVSTNGEIEGATELAFIPRHINGSNSLIPAVESTEWYTYKIPIGVSGNCYIILRGENQYVTSTYLDNFAVRECNIPITTDTKTICDSELPYTWNGVTFSEAGTQNAILQAANGCDSVVKMTLTVNPTYNVTDAKTICASELPYTWNNVTFNEAGTQSATLTTVNNCDSVVTMTLTVNPTYNVTDAKTICASELPYTWNNVTFNEAGTQTATLTTVNNCDSVVTMTLTVNPTYDVTDTKTICASELPYTWNQVEFTEAGTQTTTLTTVNNCDSVVTMTLTVNPIYDVTDTKTICASELPYTWNQVEFTEAGTQTTTLTTVNNCDSVVTMTLTVNPTYDVTDTKTICASELPYTWNNVTFNEAGTQSATLTTVNNCDSVVTMTLTVNPIYNVTDAKTICASELPYTWNNVTFNEAGTQTATLTTVNNCDSVVTMTLTVNPTYNVTDAKAICASELPYTWNNVTFNEAGTQTATLTTVNNCDSVVTMTLTVNPTYNVTDEKAICASELPYTWNNVTFNEAGTQTTTLTTVNNCDSVVTMTLSVNPIYDVTDAKTICASELPYTWNNVTFNEAGTQTATLTTVNNCDSVVTMTLIVNPTYNVTDAKTICASELPYTWNNVTFNEAGTQTTTLTTVNNCDSVVTMTLTVNPTYNVTDAKAICASELPYTWNNVTFNEAGTQTTTLTTVNNCDSVVTMTLTVNPIYNVTDAKTISSSELPYTWNGVTFTAPGTQTATMQTVNNCDSVVTMTLTVNYTITAVANPTEGGTVTGTGTYSNGTSITLTATPATGYTFINWTKNGTLVSSTATYTFTVTEAGNYVATFSQNSYEIAATANPTAGGTITGAGSYAHGQTANMVATPATGYHFVNWTKNGTQVSTNATYSFTVEGPSTLVANFELNSYEITATVNPTAGGTVNGAGTYNHFATVTLSAIPATGYTFVNWTKNGTPVSTDATYSFTATEATALVANFELMSYSITATANPTDGGSVNGAGSYNHGATANLTATANPGYAFVNWTKNGTQVSTNSTYTFTVEEAGEYVANFSQNSYTITATANPTVGGTVSGADNYNYGTSISLSADPAEGYTFVNWTKNGTQVSTSSTYTFTVEEAGEYVANFTLNSYTINATANPTAGGTVSGAGNYDYGTNATLTATANTGYTFTNWTKNGMEVSTNASYSFNVTEAATYVANFTLNSYAINAAADPTEGGTVTGAGTYNHFGSATLTATPAAGYAFINWTKNGTVVSTTSTYTFTVEAAGDYVAHFSQNSYEITATANPTAGGTIEGAGNYVHGATATLTATAATGYSFTSWTKNGTVVSNDASYSFTVTEAAAYVANFTLNSYAVTVAADPTEGGTVSGTGTFNHGTSTTLTATPATGYAFVNWTKNDAVVSTSATYTFNVTEAGAYVAHFSQNTYAISAVVTPEGSGSVTGTGNYTHGTTATLTATANEGYSFTNWTDGSTVVSTDATYSFTVEGARSLKANFTLKTYTIATTANPVDGGVVTGAGTYNHGATANLTATANTGYTFTNWTKGNEVVATSATYTVTVTEAATYVANFELNSYAINATANPTEGGTVNGAGTYNHGATANLTATANTGYTFANWTKNGAEVSTTASLSVTVTEAADYVANFTLNSYAISATANPTEGGTVTGANTYNYGETATLTATANEGYTFTNWTKNGTEVSTTATYSFTVEEAGAYVANFTLNSYELTVAANPIPGGTVSGAGTYNHGATANLTATANTGYYFVNWTKNGSVVSSSTSCAVTVTEAAEYVANFTLNSYEVTVSANPTAGGTVSGEGSYNHGATVTLTATPADNYTFTNWTKNGAEVSTDESYTFTATESGAYVANFTLMGVVATPTFSVASGIYYEAQSVNINCSTNGATIHYTTDGSTPTELSTVFNPNTPIVTTDNGTVTIKAIAMKESMITSEVASAVYRIVPKYNVVVAVNEHGTITANPTSDTTGATIILTAVAAEGYSFNDAWTVTNATTGNPIEVVNNQFTMPASNVTVSATFTLNSYTVSATANPTEGGTVGGAGTYNHNETATLTATANEGYYFVNWTKNNAVASTSTAYSFTVNEDNDYVANFATSSYNVTLHPNGGTINSGNVTSYTYTEGATLPTDVTLTGNSFGGWFDNANLGGTAVTAIAATETGNKEFWAKWTVNSYALTINYKYADGSQAAPTHTENVNYNTAYDVASPEITGYTPSLTTVSGTMGTEAVTVNVVYNINSYDLTINYKYADGSQAAPTHSETLNYNVGYSVNSPVITGYTADQTTVSGTMGTEAVTVNVTYSINSYDLTINYKYANGTQAAPAHTENINYNVGYSVTSPAITGYTPSQAIVSGTMGTANVTVDVIYNINSYALTINYKYADGTTAATTHSENVNYNAAYSVTSPVITGYTANQTTVSGTMGTEPVTVDVTYNINSYNLTINYKYANGTQAAPTHSESVNYNVGYSVTSPDITGYTPSQAIVSGTMGTANVTVDVIYNINSYALTINYKYADGSQAAPTYTQNINYNASYSVTSPAITGYTANQTIVNGTMGTEPVTVEVTYNINSYNLTINYKYANGTEAAPAHSESINYNVAYSVTSPVITGYTASQATVSGTMGTANVTVNVTYSINSYNLVINYKYADGTQAAPTHSESINYNVGYAVTSPTLNGYVANRTAVTGNMPDNNVTVNVTYYQVTTNIVNATNCAGNGNGSITVTAPTGNFEYSINGTSYQSSNVFNGLNANDYTLYIRPTGEAYNYTGTWTVASDITMPTVSMASNDSLFCLNGTVSLNGNGSSVGPEFTYAWEGPAGYSSNYKNPSSFDASNGNMSGTYTLTVTNTTTQCASSKSLNIYVNDVTNPDYVFTISGFNAVGNISLGESSTTANILTPTINHFLDGIVEDYSANNVTLSNDAPAEYTTPGDYNVTWTATDACGNTATCAIVVTITNSQCPMVQDVDGNIYSTVAVGSTCWMNSNLKTTHYADGREITHIYKYYYSGAPNVEENVSIYGLLYDWYDALDVARPTRSVRVQGICPDGWYLPNEDDFEQLNTIPATDLRSTNYWLTNPGTNASGYDLRPAGMFNHSTNRYENLHGNAYLWSASEINTTEAHCHMADCNCYMIYDLIYNKLNAFSVRCVKGE